MDLLIKNGRVIDPANKVDGKFDILIEDSCIKEVAQAGSHRPPPKKDILTIDAKGKLVTPGLIDVHVHFRHSQDGCATRTKGMPKETIRSVSRAAAKGGFTTIICQPNLNPRVDEPSIVESILDCAQKESLVNFYQSSCITRGAEHKELVNIREMKKVGAIKLTDDGDPVIYEDLMYEALKESKESDIVLSPHCESSPWSESLRFTPWAEPILSSNAIVYRSMSIESFFIKRDIGLDEKIGARLHIAHVSLASSVNEVREAKRRGLPITCEVTPQHLLLTKEDEAKYGTFAKVNPPLREKQDTDALMEGLRDGTIDVIASDHAPHSRLLGSDWESAPFGIIGVETTLSLVLSELVGKNGLSLYEAIAKLTSMPAEIFGLRAGSLGKGMPADITIIDLEKEWVVDVDKFESAGNNCPFNGWSLKGKAIMTIVGGKMVMSTDNNDKF